jgi:alpha-D-ribose 1-methylphosphonate 5-triphosphate synthase subunit PhnH
MTSLDLGSVGPGFADPVAQSQSTFRMVLDAMARPGRVLDVAPSDSPNRAGGLSPAAAAVGLTLVDFETPVWLDPTLAPAAGWLRFLCACPIVATPEAARFAFAAGASGLPPLTAFDLGSDEYPDRSTTLILEVSALRTGTGLTLSGPGIRETERLAVEGLPNTFWAARATLADLFPRGLDLILTCGTRIAALPRTTCVEV